MPLYLQVGHQDQKPSCSNKMIDKTKGDGAKKPSLPSTDLFASIGGMSREQMPPFHPRSAQCNTDNLPPLKMTKVQDKYISDTMAELREKHVNDRAAKRQKRLAWDNQDDATSIDCGSGNQSLLDKLDASPDFAQVVASPGGLITYRNQSFCKLTKQSTSLRKVPLTLFELIDPDYLPQFFGMLALALHNVTTFDSVHLITNNSARASTDATAAAIDTRDENIATPMTSHLSITLPCNKLLQSSSASSYNITVVYMNDFCSVKKCFLGIISRGKDGCNLPSSLARSNSVVSSSSTSSNDDDESDNLDKAASKKSNDSKTALPCGKILQIDDDLLFAMIKKA
eukprot:CAMPEP_0201726116 /NCGR_PEP_ID=MMETSP0593-20130828/9278_1 /ASSEMBLY_ACC=CAM_ASM_000672 /TAXON_ID=267983 /ORGANISM="Skeletonema japonicum, Strain CCMP2506" /LENGTH=340 /DNA_ID=CAMNT_0048217585 /DNA_START=188 /DNA_END=1210 /DNA_ORIENTATION=+